MKGYLSRKTLKLPQTVQFLQNMMKNSLMSYDPKYLNDPAFLEEKIMEINDDVSDEWEYEDQDEIKVSDESDIEGENEVNERESFTEERKECFEEEQYENSADVRSDFDQEWMSQDKEERIEQEGEEKKDEEAPKEIEIQERKPDEFGVQECDKIISVTRVSRKRKIGIIELLSSPKKRKSLTSEMKEIESAAKKNLQKERSVREGRGMKLWRKDPP